jgi:superoxide dismutase, Fe-Mn family
MDLSRIPRRQFLRQAGVVVAGAACAPALLAAGSGEQGADQTNRKGDREMAFTLPNLPYDYNALEPYIDEATMRVHHNGHHKAYVDNLNKALEKYPDWQNRSVEDILKDLSKVPQDIRTAVNNNGGGHSNHSIFWVIMAPNGKGGGGEPSGDLANGIKNGFGDFAKFKAALTDAGMKRFGSGWAWLCLDQSGKLVVESFANQDSPYTKGYYPVMGVDVWEHAYYLKYQNKRGDYLTAWWNLVNWPEVANRFSKAQVAGSQRQSTMVGAGA